MTSGLEQQVDGHQRRRLAHVIGLGLEGKPPQRHGTSRKVPLVKVIQLTEQNPFLAFVHALHSLQHLHAATMLRGRAYQGLHILREARPAITATGIEELVAYARIRPDTLAHHIHIGTDLFTKVRNVIHERYPRCEHRVRGILYHLGRRYVGKYQAVAYQHEGFVQAGHDGTRTRALDTHHDPVGRHEILDGDTLLQELGVRRHIKLNLHTTTRQLCGNRTLHKTRRTYGDGTFGCDNGVMAQYLAHTAGHSHHIAQIGAAILRRRGIYTTEDNLGIRLTLRQIGGEVQASGTDVTRHGRFETRLIYRHHAAAQPGNLLDIGIDTRNGNTHIGETCSRYQPDITRTYDDYIHIRN